MFRSIRWRLILSYMFLALLSVGVVGAITYQLAVNYIQFRETEGLRANAQAIALQAEPLMRSPLRRFDLQQLAETSAFLGDIRVRILDLNQYSIADSGAPDAANQVMLLVPFESELLPGMQGGVMVYHVEPGTSFELPSAVFEALPEGSKITLVERRSGPLGGEIQFKQILPEDGFPIEIQTGEITPHRSDAVVSVSIGDVSNPLGFVELSAPFDYGINLLDQLKQALVTAGLGAVILAGLFGFWNSHRLTSPLKSLAHTSAQMGAGDLSVRANVRTSGEISDLAIQFNQMAENLQTSFDQLAAERDALRRFIADASHELRTPITALKNFNTLLQDSAANDPAAQIEFLAESQTQIERLEWITANLLDLSRLDAGLLELDLAEHDLCEVVEAAIAPLNPLANKKGIHLITQWPDSSITLSVDRPRLEIAIGNLLDNALKFTPEGGEITVSLERSSDQIFVRVRDTGIGIPPQALSHVFERFYRGHGNNLKGSGLGLAIVKSVVEAHHGQVKVESKVGLGSTFTLIFPFSKSANEDIK